MEESIEQTVEKAVEIVTRIGDLVIALVCACMDLVPNGRAENRELAEFVSIKVTSILNGLETPRILPPHQTVISLQELIERSKSRWEPHDLVGFIMDMIETHRIEVDKAKES